MNGLEKMINASGEMLFSYPSFSAADRVKRLVKKTLLRQKMAPMDAYSWPNAMLGDGLLTAFAATGNRQALLDCAAYLDRWEKKECRIYYVDNIMNAALALWVEGLLEDPQILEGKGEKEEREEKGSGEHLVNAGLQKTCARIRESCADWVRSAQKTGEGILPYRPQLPDWAFVDTIGMVCPFLCRYGAQKGDLQLLRLGIRQIQLFLERGMDADTGLPYHGYDEKTGMKYSVVGWGRACGWLLMGLADSLPWITGQKKEFAQLLLGYRKLTAAVLHFQRPDGGFSWQLPAREGHRDTSAEGMIGAALAFGLRMGYYREGGVLGGRMALRIYQEERDNLQREEDRVAGGLRRLYKAMQSLVEGGRIGDSLGECADFAQYPQNYGVYPWGMGSALRFFSEMQLWEETVE